MLVGVSSLYATLRLAMGNRYIFYCTVTKVAFNFRQALGKKVNTCISPKYQTCAQAKTAVTAAVKLEVCGQQCQIESTFFFLFGMLFCSVAFVSQFHLWRNPCPLQTTA